jgi:hypothetical protein
MQVGNMLAYYDTAIITAVKRFIVQAPGFFNKDPSALLGGARLAPRYVFKNKMSSMNTKKYLTNSDPKAI